MEDWFICCDLKSFYASVECVDRGLDPLKTNLVVADESRTDKTICLAVTPPLKKLGVPGRGRLFELKQRLAEIKTFTGKQIDFITAVPRMQRYLDVSTEIYTIYLKYIAPKDIHVYSVDEAFIDVTRYMDMYGMDARELAEKIICDIQKTTGIAVTLGIGTNLYLAKVAMDISAKKMGPDSDGVRIAELNEFSFRTKLWDHRPIMDFWMTGRGIASRLARLGVYTMGDLAKTSQCGEDTLFREFGVEAAIIINHAWGLESATIKQIKGYRFKTTSKGSGQVLKRGYTYEEARNVIREMTEQVILDLVDMDLAAEGFTLYVGYEHLQGDIASYSGNLHTDHYGRKAPVSAHGTVKLNTPTAAPSKIVPAVMGLFDRIVDRGLLCRRLNVTAIRLNPREGKVSQSELFSNLEDSDAEIDLIKAELDLQHRFGKNSIFKGNDLYEAGTTIERNEQIGGHRK